ncbi:MAG: hypothetical protein ACOX2F_11760 [bacterium]
MYDISDNALSEKVFYQHFVEEKTMSYNKPEVVASNNPSGSYSAGCPAYNQGTTSECRRCDRAS